MFEALRWRKAQLDAEIALQKAAHGIAQAGKAPLVLGSLAAMAVLGMLTRMGLNGKGRGRRATVIPARFRASVENAVSSAPRNGRRRRKRKMKAAARRAAAD
jgi:hypothetical protein